MRVRRSNIDRDDRRRGRKYDSDSPLHQRVAMVTQRPLEHLVALSHRLTREVTHIAMTSDTYTPERRVRPVSNKQYVIHTNM